MGLLFFFVQVELIIHFNILFLVQFYLVLVFPQVCDATSKSSFILKLLFPKEFSAVFHSK